MEKLIYEKSRKGRSSTILPQPNVPEKPISDYLPAKFIRKVPAVARGERVGYHAALCAFVEAQSLH